MTARRSKSNCGVPKAEEGQQLAIRPSYRNPHPIIYSNVALVSHSMHDLCVDFCLSAPPYEMDDEAKAVYQDVVARVIIPTEMAEGLVKALTTQLEKHRQERDRGGIEIPVEPKE